MTCSHLDQIRDVQASGAGCKECLETGSRWVQSSSLPHLRTRRLLRAVTRQARSRSLPINGASDYRVV